MAKKKAAEPPKTDIEKQVEELQQKRKTASTQDKYLIDLQILELTKGSK